MVALLGKPEVGSPLLGTLNIMEERLYRWVSFFMGAQLGKLEWAHLPWTLRDG